MCIRDRSRGIFEVQPDGGTLLNKLASHYFGGVGGVFLALMITLACLKTAIGLVTACAETFGEMFPNKLSYKAWAVVFTLISFTFANFGLVKIIAYSVPVLMFLYPLTIVIILVSLIGGLFNYHSTVYRWSIGFTMVPEMCIRDRLCVEKYESGSSLIFFASSIRRFTLLSLIHILQGSQTTRRINFLELIFV